MVRFERLNRIQVIEGNVDVDALKAFHRRYISRPNSALEAELTRIGIHVEPLPEQIEGDALVIMNDGALGDLIYLAERLLGPGGCPWDQAQTHESLKRFLLEESYELFDAIDKDDGEKLKEELGDVLLQPIMHAKMKKLIGDFDIDDVAETLVDKLVRRHPHVFGALAVADADEVLRNWDNIKKSEQSEESRSVLAGVPRGMASLLRAYEIGKRARRAGFEWPNVESVLEKLREEEAEFREALGSGEKVQIGDLLFTVVNLARWADVEPEEALRKMLDRFTERFQAMERGAGKPLDTLNLEEWDGLWERAKAATSLD